MALSLEQLDTLERRHRICSVAGCDTRALLDARKEDEAEKERLKETYRHQWEAQDANYQEKCREVERLKRAAALPREPVPAFALLLDDGIGYSIRNEGARLLIAQHEEIVSLRELLRDWQLAFKRQQEANFNIFWDDVANGTENYFARLPSAPQPESSDPAGAGGSDAQT